MAGARMVFDGLRELQQIRKLLTAPKG